MDKKIIALGFFDGVHIGHREILGRAALRARQLGLESAALTFLRHPKGLVRGIAPPLITAYEKRRSLILQQGIGQVIALPFDAQMADMAAEDFVAMLAEDHGAAGVVCGEDFRFGKNAAGTPALLAQAGLEIIVCQKVADAGGRAVSSTAIRRLIEEGDVEKAARWLGRPFELEGTVVHGQKVGRRLGFPTLNLVPDQGLVLPRRGVYSGRVAVGREVYPALTNVGSRPTFTSADIVSVESHVLGFEGDLYGSQIAVEFLRFLRPERAFESAEALREQIERDLQAAMGRGE